MSQESTQPRFSTGTDIHQRVSEGASKLANKAEQTTDDLKDAAIQRVNRVREDAQAGIQHRRDELSERLFRLGGALRQGGEQLRAEDPWTARCVEMATQRLERAANYVARSEPRQMLQDTERLARTQPLVFFGGAFLLGLAAGRFLKSSTDADSPSSVRLGANPGAVQRSAHPGAE